MSENFIDELKNEEYFKYPPNEKKDDFLNKGIPFLKEVKDNQTARRMAGDEGVYIGSSKFVTFLEVLIGVLVIVILISAIVGGYFFLTYVKDGKFQSIDKSSVICERSELTCPTISCPDCPSCSPNINLNCTSNYYGNST